MSEKYFCTKCRMTFNVRKRTSIASEKTRCAIKGCDLLFWHNANSGFYNKAEVGIDPEDAKGLQTTGEIAA